MHCIEIVEEAHDGADEDAETGNGDGLFCLKVKEGNNKRDSNATSADSSDCAERHHKGKGKHTNHLKHRRWKDVFMATDTWNINAAHKIASITVRIFGTSLVNLAFLIFEIMLVDSSRLLRLLLQTLQLV